MADELNPASLIKIRRDNTRNWNSLNPVLEDGEFGVEYIDEVNGKCRIKIGYNGKHWLELPYFNYPLSMDDLSVRPSINNVELSGRNYTLSELGIQPVGSYISTEILVQGLATKADKATTYTSAEVDGLISNILALPAYAKGYLKCDGEGTTPYWYDLNEEFIDQTDLNNALSNYYKQGEIDNMMSAETSARELADDTLTAKTTELSNNITSIESRLADVVFEDELQDYVSKEHLEDNLENYALKSDLSAKASAEELASHINGINPHNITASTIGLGSFEGLTPITMPISEPQQSALNEKRDDFEIGEGLAIQQVGGKDTLVNTNPYYQIRWYSKEEIEDDHKEPEILNQPALEKVATSGSYFDLVDAPEIYNLPPATSETLGGIKLGDEFQLNENDQLEFVGEVSLDYNDLKNIPYFEDVDGTIYPLKDRLTAHDLNLAAESSTNSALNLKVDTTTEALKLYGTDENGQPKIYNVDEVGKGGDLSNYYTKEEANARFLTEHQDISGKADKSTTLAGYGITNAYTKNETNRLLNEKANASTVTEQLAEKQDIDNIVHEVQGVPSGSIELFYPSVKAIQTESTRILNEVDSRIASSASDLSDDIAAVDAKFANYYDKPTIDTKLSSVYKFKGSVATYADLLLIDTQDLPEGSVYNVFETNMNYAWTNNSWDPLGSVYDFTPFDNHIADKNNPHEVTKAQVGLGNVDNTSDLDKPLSNATIDALSLKADKATTLAGYNITDAYTKTETETLINDAVDSKAEQSELDSLEAQVNAMSYYTQAQIDDKETAINTKIGTLSNLTTDANTNLVLAINEVDSHSDTNASNIATLTTTVTTNDSNAVHKDGEETITGVKTFSTDNGLLALSPILTKQNSVSEGGQINFEKADNSVLTSNACIDLYDNNLRIVGHNSSSNAVIPLQADLENGNIQTLKQPASNSTSLTTVPTIGWVNDPAYSTNVVHRSGDEEIDGTKTLVSYPKVKSTRAIAKIGSDDNVVATFEGVDTDNDNCAYIHTFDDSGTQDACLALHWNNGQSYAEFNNVYTLNASDNSRKVPTTAWVNNRINAVTSAMDVYSTSQVDSAIATAISGVYRVKGSVATYSSLPIDNNVTGDVYNVLDSGDNYVWTGTEWDRLSGTVDISTAAMSSIVNLMYPVGSIFIGVTASCPLATYAGTWELVSTGRVLWGSDSSHAAGTTIEPGLPNIEGSTYIREAHGRFQGLQNNTGCIEVADSGVMENANGGGDTGGNMPRQLKINASRSSTIYGNSSTVQPPAYVVNMWQRTA